MTGILAFAAFLVLPLIGVGIWRLDAVRRMDLPARVAVAGAAGAVITGAVMTVLSIAGIAWSRGVLLAIFAAIAAVNLLAARDSTRRQAGRAENLTATLLAVFILLTVYGLLDARESCGDLHFFWGPKAVRFYRDGGIRLTFLADPNTVRMNPGYPLLLPLLYAWSHTLAGQFSWWAAVLSTALFIFGSAAIVRGMTGDDKSALLMAATLSYAVAIAFAAGGGDPPLVFFETLTLAALTFLDDPRARTVLAALGLAGAVMLKIEGTTFAIAVVLADLLLRRDIRRTLAMAAPAAVLIGAWLWFVKANHLFELYRGAAMPIYFHALPKTLAILAKTASYDLFGLPWLVPIVLIALGDIRRAALPLAVALLTFGAAIFFYIHLQDPTWWILSSAPRVLLTPLTALIMAAIAAWNPVLQSRGHGLVPQGKEA